MQSDETLLRVRGLKKVYRSGLVRRKKHEALAGVDLEVGRGSVFGLLGPNGAGKTTMVKILLGLVRGHTGEATIFGQPAGTAAARRRVGYLPEAHRLPQYLTGNQVMTLFGMLAGKPRDEVRRRTPALLEQVDMSESADRKVKEYSKGMQQRLGLAQALVHDPELVFLDEPTDGVDPVGRAAIREMVSTLKARGVTIFINSHLLMEVEMICDRIVILDKGRILKEGTIDDFTAATGNVRFEVDELPGDVQGALAGLGEFVPRDERSFELRTDEEGTNAAIDRLRAKGVRIRGITSRRISLEEAFIDLVGKERA